MTQRLSGSPATNMANAEQAAAVAAQRARQRQPSHGQGPSSTSGSISALAEPGGRPRVGRDAMVSTAGHRTRAPRNERAA
ncbi:MAG TPA: hypothetical protein VIL43_06885, partial [Burkholderiales bacterium]